MRRRGNTRGKLEFNGEEENENDPSLPYGGRVVLAKKKKRDPWYILIIQIFLVVFTLFFCVYAFYYFDYLQFYTNSVYARLGFSHAQNLIGLKYLQGHGVEQNHSLAFHWLKKASDQGHPHASYNLAIGHFEGAHEYLKENDEAHRLIKHAAKNGLSQAKQILRRICRHENCET